MLSDDKSANPIDAFVLVATERLVSAAAETPPDAWATAFRAVLLRCFAEQNPNASAAESLLPFVLLEALLSETISRFRAALIVGNPNGSDFVITRFRGHTSECIGFARYADSFLLSEMMASRTGSVMDKNDDDDE